MIDPELQSAKPQHIVGIVGSEELKFTPQAATEAMNVIHLILCQPDVTGITSGHCPLDGVDIWAEEIGKDLGLELFIFAPKTKNWDGFKARNIEIARKCTEIHCITPRVLRNGSKEFCYHCNTRDHVKSGGCWTVKYAQGLGKKGFWHVI